MTILWEDVFPYIFAEKKYPGVPQVVMHTISSDPFTIGALEIIPIRMMHYQLPVLGFRIGDFAYLTDGNQLPGEEKKKLTGLRALAVNALRREPHISHFSVGEAVELIGELNPEKGYLTHISHQMGPSGLFREELPLNVLPAYDGLVLEL